MDKFESCVDRWVTALCYASDDEVIGFCQSLIDAHGITVTWLSYRAAKIIMRDFT